MGGPNDATQRVDQAAAGEPPLEETLLGDPADLHATEVAPPADQGRKKTSNGFTPPPDPSGP